MSHLPQDLVAEQTLAAMAALSHHGATWRNGLVLDPFAGSGTTLAVATGHGRESIGIDLDPRNADLARERVGMFLEVEEGARPPPAKGGKVAGVEPVDVRSDLL